jgi:ATP-binding cassette subfamily B protein
MKLIHFLKPYWKAALAAPLLMLLEVAMDLLQPVLMAKIINEGVLQRDLSVIQSVGLLALGVAFIGLVTGVGCGIFATTASLNFATDLREALFRKIQSFSFRNLEKFKTGSLVTRLTNDVTQVQNLVMTALRMMIRTPFTAIGSVLMAFLISPRLAMILAIAAPFLGVAVYLLVRLSYPLFLKVQNKLDTVNSVVQENLAGIRVVKAFVRSDYEIRRFAQVNEEYTQTAISSARFMILNMPIMQIVLNASIIAVLWFGGGMVWTGSLSLGGLIAFINYATQVLSSLLSLSVMLVSISRAKVSADRINEVLRHESEEALDGVDAEVAAGAEAEQAIEAVVGPKAEAAADMAVGAETRALTGGLTERQSSPLPGRVEYENVSFSYNDSDARLAVRDVSFVAEPGETVAFLGSTGSGKSTLVGLLPRLYEARSGRIRLSGEDIRNVPLDRLRGKIAFVLQESILFTGTIRDNLRYGKPDATDEETEAAAKAAQAHDFIVRLPDGYDTIVGQRGVNLSGGQKQRIAIARALLMQPEVLILDDSTSAVDLGTESRIQAALRSLMKQCTTLVIAQRITSVMDADVIVVLEDGCAVASGSHRELLANNAVYQDIYYSQLEKEGTHG